MRESRDNFRGRTRWDRNLDDEVKKRSIEKILNSSKERRYNRTNSPDRAPK